MQELNRVHKARLLTRAKKVARLCFEQWEDWDMEAVVQGGIDDTADERAYQCNFDGPREVAYEYLDDQREEIAWELFETPSKEA